MKRSSLKKALAFVAITPALAGPMTLSAQAQTQRQRQAQPAARSQSQGQPQAQAQGQAQGQAPRIAFTRYTLSNGLKVILHQDRSTPIVAVSVMYHVGSKNEQPTRTGFAHFFEHLLFEGSPNIGRGEYGKIIQNAGGQLNANTSFDRTFYYQVLPSNQLELAMYMESERLLHAKIDPQGVETQREVVKEEKRQRYDNQPYGQLLPRIFQMAYREHPYQWVPIGSLEHLNAATLDEFIQFYKDFYVPENAILSIAGDIDIETTKRLVERYYAPIPRGGKKIYRPSIVEPPLGGERRDTILDNISLPAVVTAYRGPKQTDPDAYAMSVLADYLTGGKSARMTREIQDRQQKAASISSFNFALEDPGLFIAFGLANQGVDPGDLERSMQAEIKRVRDELIPERELERVINQIEASNVARLGSVRSLAEQLAQYEMYYGDAGLINTEIERYRRVTREDVQRVAQKYLGDDNRVVLYFLPKPAN